VRENRQKWCGRHCPAHLYIDQLPSHSDFFDCVQFDTALDDKGEAPVLKDEDLDVVQEILSQEFTFRNYNSILNVHTKHMPKKGEKEEKDKPGKFKEVLKILDRLVSKDAKDHARNEQEAKEAERKKLKYNTREENWMANQKLEYEKKKKDAGKGAEFDEDTFARSMMNNQHGSLMSKPKKEEKQKPAKPVEKVTPKKPEKKVKLKLPIIMVPQGRTALVNMFNAQTFLQDAQFVSKPTGSKPTKVVVDRKMPNKKVVRFEVVDQVKQLQDSDWDRVVLVLIQGPEWQFKGWGPGGKWKSITEILERVAGYHLYYEDEKLNEKVSQWQCKSLKLSKHKRHLDSVVHRQLWQTFDKWCIGRNVKHLAL